MKSIVKIVPVCPWLLIFSCIAYGLSYSQKVTANPTSSETSGNTVKVNPVKANQKGKTFQERYVCVQKDGKYATVAQTHRGPIELIVWKSTFFGPQFTPAQRCQMVSQRFQALWDRGQLKFLNVGKMNQQNVICATSKTGIEGCLHNGLLITLEPKDDPHTVLNELFFSRSNRTGGTFRGEQKPIDFNRLLQERSPLTQPAQNRQETPALPPTNKTSQPPSQPVPW